MYVHNVIKSFLLLLAVIRASVDLSESSFISTWPMGKRVAPKIKANEKKQAVVVDDEDAENIQPVGSRKRKRMAITDDGDSDVDDPDMDNKLQSEDSHDDDDDDVAEGNEGNDANEPEPAQENEKADGDADDDDADDADDDADDEKTKANEANRLQEAGKEEEARKKKKKRKRMVRKLQLPRRKLIWLENRRPLMKPKLVKLEKKLRKLELLGKSKRCSLSITRQATLNKQTLASAKN